MERMITNLFDFQRFLQNPKLASIILDTEDRCGRALSDDDLEWVSAAGEDHPLPEYEAGEHLGAEVMPNSETVAVSGETEP